MFPDGCEVGDSDVVGEGLEVEFTSLGVPLAACEVVSVASFQYAVNGFRLAALMVPFQECCFVLKP